MKNLLLILLFIINSYSEPITAIPQKVSVESEKVSLGKALFFDTIVSRDNTISCASCHDLKSGGDDNLKFSFGIDGQKGDINAPTVFNAVYNFRQFWNGSAQNLADQAKGPIQNPVEMGNTFKNLIKTLNKTPYKSRFESLYADGVTADNIVDAIAEFEKTLTTPNSQFDKYLRGDSSAITQKQKDGYTLFKSKGCIACHHGVNVGGNLYNKFGIMKDVESKRLGRYEVTRSEADKYYFKVPSLRNIAQTSPYLHDGRFNKLEDTVKFMAHYQLGRTISQDEIDKIVAFLNSLTGEIPKVIQ